VTERPSEPESDDSDRTTDVPSTEKGVGVGAAEPSTFEPEEDPSTTDDDR
jgi:hypothetical protein